MNSQKVVLGVLAGVAAGALLGVLFAPEKGSVVRQNISDKSHDYAGVVKTKFNEFIDSIVGKFDTVNEDINEAAEKVEEKANRAMA